jgi:hypothetical protein
VPLAKAPKAAPRVGGPGAFITVTGSFPLIALIGTNVGAWPFEQSGVLTVRIAPDLERPQPDPRAGAVSLKIEEPE